MARTKKRIFDGLYAQLEETDGNVVLFSAKGEPSVIFEITNPVQQLRGEKRCVSKFGRSENI